MAHFRDSSGFGFISILVALAIIGLLYVGFVGISSGGTPPAHRVELAKGASLSTACANNRRAAEIAISTWSASHPNGQPTLEKLKQSGVRISSCPEKGTLTLKDRKVVCSLHS